MIFGVVCSKFIGYCNGIFYAFFIWGWYWFDFSLFSRFRFWGFAFCFFRRNGKVVCRECWYINYLRNMYMKSMESVIVMVNEFVVYSIKSYMIDV